MTTKTEVIEYVECDMCHAKDIRMRKYQVVIANKTLDICFNCFLHLKDVMAFLNNDVGLGIEWKAKKDD